MANIDIFKKHYELVKTAGEIHAETTNIDFLLQLNARVREVYTACHKNEGVEEAFGKLIFTCADAITFQKKDPKEVLKTIFDNNLKNGKEDVYNLKAV